MEILPGRDVEDAVGIIIGELGKNIHLLRRHATKWDLDALHAGSIPERVGALHHRTGGVLELLTSHAVVSLTVVVALSVYASAEPRLVEKFLVQLALTAKLDLCLVDVDLSRQLGRHLVRELLPPVGRRR